MRSSVSIVLFLLLSVFFLAALLGAIERSRKLLAVAGGCLVVLACIIVFVKPVQLPSLRTLRYGSSTTTTGTTASPSTGTTGGPSATSPATLPPTTGVTSTTGVTPATGAVSGTSATLSTLPQSATTYSTPPSSVGPGG